MQYNLRIYGNYIQSLRTILIDSEGIIVRRRSVAYRYGNAVLFAEEYVFDAHRACEFTEFFPAAAGGSDIEDDFISCVFVGCEIRSALELVGSDELKKFLIVVDFCFIHISK